MIYIPILNNTVNITKICKEITSFCINEEYGIRNESRILYIVIGCYIKLT